jgi:hypothetical protein
VQGGEVGVASKGIDDLSGGDGLAENRTEDDRVLHLATVCPLLGESDAAFVLPAFAHTASVSSQPVMPNQLHAEKYTLDRPV